MSKFAVRTEQFSMYKYGAATLILFLSLASALSYAMPKKNDWDEGHVEIIHSLLETYNTNDPKAIEGFAKERFSDRFLNTFPMDAHLQNANENFQTYGSIKFHSILNLKIHSRDQELKFLANSNRTEQWVSISI